jgi:hypothetical protein
VTDARCSDRSRDAGEPLHATATFATRWLLVEVPGGWPRDVSRGGALPPPAAAAAAGWLAGAPASKLLFVRRPGRAGGALVAFVVAADEGAAQVRRLELAAHEDLAAANLERDGDPVDHPLVLVCGHGSRDACCALRGAPVFGALADALPEDALWISSHHGGHRFAANVLVLPAGLHFGRVEPEHATTLVARALAGTIDLDAYRGRTCYPAEIQAAEQAIRLARGLDGVEDLRLLDAADGVVRFSGRDGRVHAATVERRDGPVVPASCGAEPEAQPVLVATPA